MSARHPNKHNWIPVPGYEAPSLSALAREHGLPTETLWARWDRGDRGADLVRPSGNQGKPILWGGKTFDKWHTILAINGSAISLAAVKNYYYSRTRVYGESPEEALKRFKQLHGL